MTNKNRILIRVSSFCLIFFLVFSFLTRVFTPRWGGVNGQYNRTRSFYSIPENSLDVIFFGTSIFHRGVSPLTMWEQQGFTSYVRASPAQDPFVTYYYLVESLQYQTPKVVVIGANTIFEETNVDRDEGLFRKAIDPLRISIAKIKLTNEVVKNSKNQTISSYIFPLLRYHSRWVELSKNDINIQKLEPTPLRGFMPSYITNEIEPPDDYYVSH